MTALDLAAIALYFVAVLGVALYSSTRIHNLADFVVAGRTLTAPILVGSLVATYYGLDVTFGAPETSFLEGMSTFYVYSAPFYVSYALLALYIAAKARASEALTLPEYFAGKFGKGILLPTSVVTFSFSLPVMSVFGFGVLGEYFFDLPQLWGMLIGGLFAALYASIGGMLADAMTDFLQFILMVLSVILIAFIAMGEVGTLSDFGAALAPEMTTVRGSLGLADIIVYLAVALTPLVDPGLYQRIFAARSVRDVRRALLASTLIWMAFDWLVVYLGLVAAYLVTQGAIAPIDDPSRVVLHLAAYFLPAGLMGVFIAGILSTAMSTIDSYAIIASTAVVRGMSKGETPEAGTRASARELLLIRIGIPLVILLSILVAARFERVRDTWIVMASLLVSGLLIPLALSFIPRRGEKVRRFAVAACWGGILSAIGLFLMIETAGVEDIENATRRLALIGGLGIVREHIVFLSVPIALACGAFGAWFRRWSAEPATA